MAMATSLSRRIYSTLITHTNRINVDYPRLYKFATLVQMEKMGDYGKLPASASGHINPFEIDIPEQTLRDMQTLLKTSPIAKTTYENSREGRALGLDRQWLEAAVRRWQTSFDWRKHEAHANSFPQFKAHIIDNDGEAYDIHFAGLFSTKPNATPIILLHGWPGSFLEFLPMLSIMRDRHTPDTLPYHLVVPSLPGYGFSSAPPTTKDFRVEDAARLVNRLAAALGFKKYIVQGGDVGSKVARAIGQYPTVCAVHLNFCVMPEPVESDIEPKSLNALDRKGLYRTEEFHRIGSAYALEHATKPATISFALQSSPLALLSWIAEKFLDWTDVDPTVDEILASVTLYWVTGCIATSLWPYRQLFTPGPDGQSVHRNHGQPEWRLKKFGFSWFPKEIAPIPKAWAETTGNLVWFRQHDKGGHFAAVEQTEVLLQDLEDFVASIWEQ